MAPRSLPPCAPCTAPVVGTTSGSPSLNVAVHPSCHALLPRPRPRPSLQTPVPPDLTSLGRTQLISAPCGGEKQTAILMSALAQARSWRFEIQAFAVRGEV